MDGSTDRLFQVEPSRLGVDGSSLVLLEDRGHDDGCGKYGGERENRKLVEVGILEELELILQ